MSRKPARAVRRLDGVPSGSQNPAHAHDLWLLVRGGRSLLRFGRCRVLTSWICDSLLSC